MTFVTDPDCGLEKHTPASSLYGGGRFRERGGDKDKRGAAIAPRARVKFLEYQAHAVFRKYGIPVPSGALAAKPEDLVNPPLPCAVKAQVLIGGGGGGGGGQVAQTP